MRIRSVAVRVLAVGLVISCTADLPVGPGGVERSMRDRLSTSDDCAITIAAIDSFALLVTASSLALPDSTSPSDIDSLSDYSAAHRRALIDDFDLDPTVWDDFVRRSRESVPLCTGIRDRLAVSATSSGALRGVEGDWLQRQAGMAHGSWPNIVFNYIVFVTQAGVSDDGRQALIEVSGTCGGLCGSGWLVVLERTDDRWQVRGMLMTWVS